MKKLLAIIGLMGIAYFSSFAIDATFSVAPNGVAQITNYINGPLLVTALQFVQGGGNAVVTNVIVYDSPQTNSILGPVQGYSINTYSNGTYTNIQQYVTNISVVYTGFSGSKWTNTERFVRTFTNLVAGTTNEYRRVFSVTLPATAGSVVNIPISANGVWFAKGFSVSNSLLTTNVSINISYFPGL